MTKEHFAWITAAQIINRMNGSPIVDDEDHEDDEIIQPLYDALMAFGERYAELKGFLRFKKGQKVKHRGGDIGRVLDTRDDPQGYKYLVEFPTRTDWFKEEVLG